MHLRKTKFTSSHFICTPIQIPQLQKPFEHTQSFLFAGYSKGGGVVSEMPITPLKAFASLF